LLPWVLGGWVFVLVLRCSAGLVGPLVFAVSGAFGVGCGLCGVSRLVCSGGCVGVRGGDVSCRRAFLVSRLGLAVAVACRLALLSAFVVGLLWALLVSRRCRLVTVAAGGASVSVGPWGRRVLVWACRVTCLVSVAAGGGSCSSCVSWRSPGVFSVGPGGRRGAVVSACWVVPSGVRRGRRGTVVSVLVVPSRLCVCRVLRGPAVWACCVVSSGGTLVSALRVVNPRLCTCRVLGSPLVVGWAAVLFFVVVCVVFALRCVGLFVVGGSRIFVCVSRSW
jgi:hypothetical protein